jgi:hypothetical protein
VESIKVFEGQTLLFKIKKKRASPETKMKISIPINMMSVLAGLGICTLIVAGGLVMWIYLWLNKFGFTFDKGIPTKPKPLD